MTAPAIRYLSFGWGVQSWTIAAMMALGELPRVDYLIHADTRHERQATYDFRAQWEPWLVANGLTAVTVQGSRTEVVHEVSSASVMIPAFTVDNKTGSHGQVRRQCTHDWKIAPIRHFIRAQMEHRRIPVAPGVAEAWLGISWDECSRVRDSDVIYTTNYFPLVERRITRAGCVAWLESHGLPVPPKSSCTFCPFRNMESWRQLKRQGGVDWREAVTVDAAIRKKRPQNLLYVHPIRKPLEEAVSIPEDSGGMQMSFDNSEQPCDSGYCWT